MELQLRCSKIKFEREFRFHPTRLWRLDFAWPEKKIGVEVEGGIWRPGGGAHSRPSNIERDIEKHNTLMQMGWRVLRITGKHLDSGEGLKMIEEILGGT